MSTRIDVRCEAITGGAWACAVGIDDGDGAPTRHDVTVTTDELAHLSPGATEPTDLVRCSFEFLLEREPKSSILNEGARTGRRPSDIYGANGRPCPRCGTLIRTETYGGELPRLAYWCPTCQPDPREDVPTGA